MAYWWVNMGKGFEQARDGGFLWAPLGRHPAQNRESWRVLEDVRPDDVVFCHAKGHIIAVATPLAKPVAHERPPSLSAMGWPIVGYLVPTLFSHVDKPLAIGPLRSELEPLMPAYDAPMNRVWRANQGYMYAISPALGRRLLHHLSMAPAGHLDTATNFSDVQVSSDTKTQREALVSSRIGQGKFRREVIERWEGKCCLTGLTLLEILRASHIKPWMASNNRERLDPVNGLLLSPNFDAVIRPRIYKLQ